MMMSYRSSVIISVTVVLVSTFLFIMLRDTQDKNRYHKIIGEVTYMDDHYKDFPLRQTDKFRYLRLNNYPYVFEVFIGKGWSDFAPAYEQVDQLKRGDTITVDEYEADDIAQDSINRNVKLISKDNITYFKAGSPKNLLWIVVVILCLLMIAGGYMMGYRRKKIPM